MRQEAYYFVDWFRQRVKKKSPRSLCFCLICCNWYLANLWFTFGATCFSNRSQILAGFVLSSVFSQLQLLYVSNPCLLIYNKMNEACSFSDFFKYSPLKISAVFLEFRQFVSQIWRVPIHVWGFDSRANNHVRSLGVFNRLKVGYFDVFRLALVSSNSWHHVESIKQPRGKFKHHVLMRWFEELENTIYKNTWACKRLVRARTDHATCHVTGSVIRYITGTDHYGDVHTSQDQNINKAAQWI